MAKIDTRSKADILKQLKERSLSYTPEWNMSESNPDIASALAAAYADMFAGTLKKINNVPYKNKVAFYNTTNASLLPSVPSDGYVSFSLANNDVENTQVVAGTVLTAPSDEADSIHFETVDDILVVGTDVEKIFCADDTDDYIGEYNFKEENLVLFDKSRPNLQSHILHISHPYIFDVVHGAKIGLSFYQRSDIPVPAAYIKALADKNTALIEYFAGEEQGFVAFERVFEQGGRLFLCKGEKQPRIMAGEDEEEGQKFTLRVTVSDVSCFEKFAFLRAEASASGNKIECDVVSDGSTEYEKTKFFPFGERFQLYNEVYFGCNEVLNKRGSEVTMSFNISFEDIPIENQLLDDEINWKWIANKGDFKKSKEYDITISEVLWEYYNGSGWSRLFKDDSYGKVFSVNQGVRELYRSIKFSCPKDIAPVFVSAGENFFIRARILKAENLYKLRGKFISPVISNLSLDYKYDDTWCQVTDITANNNLETVRLSDFEYAQTRTFVPFHCTGVMQSAVYLGFSTPPDSGPFRIYWDILENGASQQTELLWEYLSESGWKSVNMADETEGFKKSGLTVFLDNPHFEKTTLFKSELFWIRICDVTGFYRANADELPFVEGMYINTVRAVNVDSHKEEFFAMEVYQENAAIALSDKHILDFALYVNEASSISDSELKTLESKGLVEIISDSTGIVTEIWVRWNEVNTFISENSDSRSYIIDKSNGILSFGNGRNGRIPSVSDTENIRAVYTTGGGTHTNVDIGEINSLERSIGFVTGVSNPKRFCGGCDTETLNDAMKRCAVMIKTQGKAVTAGDYERLAMNSVRTIDKVKCFAGYNASGERENGAVTLVVLRSDNSEFSEIREKVNEYLLPRIAGGISMTEKLYITEPEFAQINVRVGISVKSMNNVFNVKKAVEERLEKFLDTLNGGFDTSGWRIGQIPNEQQIRSCIMGLENIVYISSLYTSTLLTGTGGLVEIDKEAAKKHKYLLPQNGKHEIIISLA